MMVGKHVCARMLLNSHNSDTSVGHQLGTACVCVRVFQYTECVPQPYVWPAANNSLTLTGGGGCMAVRNTEIAESYLYSYAYIPLRYDERVEYTMVKDSTSQTAVIKSNMSVTH